MGNMNVVFKAARCTNCEKLPLPDSILFHRHPLIRKKYQLGIITTKGMSFVYIWMFIYKGEHLLILMNAFN